MYKTNGEQCKKCGKLFHPKSKVFRKIDSNGNPLEIELCDKCEFDDMVKDIMKVRNITYEEARTFLWNKMHKTLLDAEMIRMFKPLDCVDVVDYNNYWIEQTRNSVPKVVQFRNMASIMLEDEMLNAVVRMVKDNE